LNALKTRRVTPNYVGEQLVEGAALNCHSGEKKKKQLIVKGGRVLGFEIFLCLYSGNRLLNCLDFLDGK